MSILVDFAVVANKKVLCLASTEVELNRVVAGRNGTRCAGVRVQAGDFESARAVYTKSINSRTCNLLNPCYKRSGVGITSDEVFARTANFDGAIVQGYRYEAFGAVFERLVVSSLLNGRRVGELIFLASDKRAGKAENSEEDEKVAFHGKKRLKSEC